MRCPVLILLKSPEGLSGRRPLPLSSPTRHHRRHCPDRHAPDRHHPCRSRSSPFPAVTLPSLLPPSSPFPTFTVLSSPSPSPSRRHLSSLSPPLVTTVPTVTVATAAATAVTVSAFVTTPAVCHRRRR